MRQDSTIGVPTRYGTGGPGIESRWVRDFPHPSRPALGPIQPHTQWVPGVKQSGCGVNNLSPSSAEVTANFYLFKHKSAYSISLQSLTKFWIHGVYYKMHLTANIWNRIQISTWNQVSTFNLKSLIFCFMLIVCFIYSISIHRIPNHNYRHTPYFSFTASTTVHKASTMDRLIDQKWSTLTPAIAVFRVLLSVLCLFHRFPSILVTIRPMPVDEVVICEIKYLAQINL